MGCSLAFGRSTAEMRRDAGVSAYDPDSFCDER